MKPNFVLNPYELRARYLPAILTISPVIIWLYLWFPEIRSLKGTSISLLVGLGISIPLSILARDLGNKKQEILLTQWGALPATLILRNNDDTLNRETKQRYHQKLKLLTNVDIPTLEMELENPLEANQKFDSCIDYLRQSTRDINKYRLVFNENISYGQIRNLLGLKPVGLIICTLLLVIQLYSIYRNYGVGLNISAVPILYLVSVVINFSFLYFWTFLVNSKKVYTAGLNYGKALIESCQQL